MRRLTKIRPTGLNCPASRLSVATLLISGTAIIRIFSCRFSPNILTSVRLLVLIQRSKVRIQFSTAAISTPVNALKLVADQRPDVICKPGELLPA
jgi:hypothetical protein